MTRREIIRPVRVVNQIGPFVADALAAFGDRLRLLPGERNDPVPWAVEGADILLTAPSAHWRTAPDRAPSSWGGGPTWVQVASVGVDAFPDWLLRDRIVTCGRGAASEAIAEYVLGALLMREKRFDAGRPVDRSVWLAQAAAVKTRPLGGLAGRTLGIAGFGSIGTAIARRACAFGANVRAWRRGAWSRNADIAVTPAASLVELVAESDMLVLALPLTAETRGIVDAVLLSHARPDLHLVNVARGELVDTPALLEALDARRIGFATLDVTDPEPLPDGHPFWSHPSIRLTPHISWSGPTVADDLGRRIAENVARFLDGRPLNDIVDPWRGY